MCRNPWSLFSLSYSEELDELEEWAETEAGPAPTLAGILNEGEQNPSLLDGIPLIEWADVELLERQADHRAKVAQIIHDARLGA